MRALVAVVEFAQLTGVSTSMLKSGSSSVPWGARRRARSRRGSARRTQHDRRAPVDGAGAARAVAAGGASYARPIQPSRWRSSCVSTRSASRFVSGRAARMRASSASSSLRSAARRSWKRCRPSARSAIGAPRPLPGVRAPGMRRYATTGAGGACMPGCAAAVGDLLGVCLGHADVARCAHSERRAQPRRRLSRRRRCDPGRLDVAAPPPRSTRRERRSIRRSAIASTALIASTTWSLSVATESRRPARRRTKPSGRASARTAPRNELPVAPRSRRPRVDARTPPLHDPLDELLGAQGLDPLQQPEDLRRVLHTAATKALKVLQQRTLAAFELLFPDLLDGPHQSRRASA